MLDFNDYDSGEDDDCVEVEKTTNKFQRKRYRQKKSIQWFFTPNPEYMVKNRKNMKMSNKL